ncbi:MAG: hypothetical protein FJW39_24135 [Acidobacteria bacterium]|nr:hypothetical protein [Acidobacteriota bacterium]
MKRILKNAITAAAVCLSIASLAAADKQEAFKPGPPESYSGHQKQGGFAAGASAYTGDAETRAPFGKLNPYDHGVLPVLLVVKNGGKETLNLAGIRARYVDQRGRKTDFIPAAEVKFLRAPAKPRVGPGPIPGINRKPKNPLAAIEIESRGFSAKMLPPGDSAHGFFYFQAEHTPGSILYITGIKEASTGNELFYMEIPIN